MYFRLFAFDFLQPKIEKLLYLDADVICKGSLKELVDVDLTKKIAAVVKDVESIQKMWVNGFLNIILMVNILILV